MLYRHEELTPLPEERLARDKILDALQKDYGKSSLTAADKSLLRHALSSHDKYQMVQRFKGITPDLDGALLNTSTMVGSRVNNLISSL